MSVLPQEVSRLPLRKPVLSAEDRPSDLASASPAVFYTVEQVRHALAQRSPRRETHPATTSYDLLLDAKRAKMRVRELEQVRVVAQRCRLFSSSPLPRLHPPRAHTLLPHAYPSIAA